MTKPMTEYERQYALLKEENEKLKALIKYMRRPGKSIATERIAKLEEALAPFAHPDLCRTLGGNVQGGDSPVFQRCHAVLQLKHFHNAAKALGGKVETDND